jgi:hypothetical protein
MLYISMRLLNGNLFSTLADWETHKVCNCRSVSWLTPVLVVTEAGTTTDCIKALFFWPMLSKDVHTFCNSCQHCCSTAGDERTPRPFAQALHASNPNEISCFYLYMGPSKSGYKYLLPTKDDLSEYLWLVPNNGANTATTVYAQGCDIMRLVWRKFGYPFLGPFSKAW